MGGNITSMASPDGFRWEEGPNSFQPNDSMLKAAVRLPQTARGGGTRTSPGSGHAEAASDADRLTNSGTCGRVAEEPRRRGQVDAGVEQDLVLGDPKAPRFVWWERKLRPTPSGPDALTFDLLTLGGKLRAGLGAIGIKQGPPGAARRQWQRGARSALCCMRRPASSGGWHPRTQGRKRRLRGGAARQALRRAWSSLCGATWARRRSSA